MTRATLVQSTCAVLISCCSIIDLKYVTEIEKQMKNIVARGFMHTVTIYGSEHIQHNMTFDISMMCRYICRYSDVS